MRIVVRSLVIPGRRVSDEPGTQGQICRPSIPWVPDRAPRVRNDGFNRKVGKKSALIAAINSLQTVLDREPNLITIGEAWVFTVEERGLRFDRPTFIDAPIRDRIDLAAEVRIAIFG